MASLDSGSFSSLVFPSTDSSIDSTDARREPRGLALTPTPSVQPSPHEAAAEAQCRVWALQHGLVQAGVQAQRFATLRCGSGAAHAYPRASQDVVELGANLMAWLLLFDGSYREWDGGLTELEATLQTFEPLLFSGQLPADPTPLHRGLADVRQRVIALGGTGLQLRFAYSMRRYFDGCLLELPYRKNGRSPKLSVYRSVRRWSIGALPVLDLVELTLERPIDPATAAKESVWALRDRAATLCAWSQDLYAFHRAREDHEPPNLISVLMRERNLPIDAAFAEAVRLYNAELGAFQLALEGFVRLASTSRIEGAYLRGVGEWVYGYQQWMRLSRR